MARDLPADPPMVSKPPVWTARGNRYPRLTWREIRPRLALPVSRRDVADRPQRGTGRRFRGAAVTQPPGGRATCLSQLPGGHGCMSAAAVTRHRGRAQAARPPASPGRRHAESKPGAAAPRGMQAPQGAAARKGGRNTGRLAATPRRSAFPRGGCIRMFQWRLPPKCKSIPVYRERASSISGISSAIIAAKLGLACSRAT